VSGKNVLPDLVHEEGTDTDHRKKESSKDPRFIVSGRESATGAGEREDRDHGFFE
jgi:hypothetical protein